MRKCEAYLLEVSRESVIDKTNLVKRQEVCQSQQSPPNLPKPKKMPTISEDSKVDDKRAVAYAVANLVLALHFDLLTFLCDNLFKKGQCCQMTKFDPFLSSDCARVEGVGAGQSKERKEGIKFCSVA